MQTRVLNIHPNYGHIPTIKYEKLTKRLPKLYILHKQRKILIHGQKKHQLLSSHLKHYKSYSIKCLYAQSITYPEEKQGKDINNVTYDDDDNNKGKEDKPNKKIPENIRWLKIRGFTFYACGLLLSAPLFFIMLCLYPFAMLFDKHRRCLMSSINTIWAKLTSFPFYTIKVKGIENLTSKNEAVVYVSNHQSHLDIFALLYLDRPFKYISKIGIFLIPIVGWSMFLTGHLMINRADKVSQLKCLQKCHHLLSKKASVLFFPEGTRSQDNRLQEFKKGAFSVALKANVPIQPITIWGSGELMPNGKDMELHHGNMMITVHPKIDSKGKTALELRDLCRNAIASALPMEYRPS